VDSPETCAERALHLLQHPEEVKVMGERAREHVRGNFLITHQLKDYLELLAQLADL
jgi:trehalose synthase